MKFFDLSLGGLGAKEATFTNQGWVANEWGCSIGHYAGGTTPEVCSKSTLKLKDVDSYYKDNMNYSSQNGYVKNNRYKK